MRVLFCKTHCPFICFCKPSSHIYTPRPLKLESSPHVASTTAVVSVSNDHHVDADSVGVKEESVVVDEKKQERGEGGGEAGENCIKSSLKKEALYSKEVEKKKVQWMDFLGKELVEIREFETRWVLSLSLSRFCVFSLTLFFVIKFLCLTMLFVVFWVLCRSWLPFLLMIVIEMDMLKN